MKHKILTPIIFSGGIGGIVTPIFFNTIGVVQTENSATKTESREDTQLKSKEDLGTQEAEKNEIVQRPKRRVSSLFL